MAESDKVFSGSIAENYDRFMVPMIFQDYAQEIADRVAALSPRDVLETAAGSGVVTRALAPKLAASARYVASDLNQPMLDYAASRQPVDSRITWKVADALKLPFADGSFDVVLCQFGVMFFPDRVAGYREAKRVLRPGGRFVFEVWDRIEDNVFADDVTQALAKLFPADPPRFLARTPHGYYDTAAISQELAAAGFGDVAIETIAKESPAPSAHYVAQAFCEGTPLRNEIEARGGNLEQATALATRAVARRHGEGAISAKIQAHLVSAKA